jgi:serine/threonine protein kinase
MGEVYAAEDTKLHRNVALKILPPEMADNPEHRRRFEREAQAIAALNHPNIVTIYSVEESQGVHFLTMELVEGKTLAERIPKEGYSLERLLQLGLPLVDGVAAAHKQGIIHRDLKPANVMVTAEDQPKVLDFGLAKVHESRPMAQPETEAPTTSATREGHIIGTVAYMSPEQAEGRTVDARSDVFSLGILLYEMATGTRPFEGQTSISILSAILKDEPRPVTELNRRLPQAMNGIVERCLAKEAEERFQSAADLRAALRQLQTQSESGRLHSVSEQIAATPASRLRPLLTALGAVLALGLVTLGILWGVTKVRSGAESASTASVAGEASLAIFPFENQTGEEGLDFYGSSASEWLSVDLAGMPSVAVLSSHRLLDTQRKTDGDADALDPSQAAAVAAAAGARYLLRGATLKLGDQVFLKAEVIEVSSGRVVSAQRIPDVSGENLTAKLGELAKLLRADLEEIQ